MKDDYTTYYYFYQFLLLRLYVSPLFELGSEMVFKNRFHNLVVLVPFYRKGVKANQPTRRCDVMWRTAFYCKRDAD